MGFISKIMIISILVLIGSIVLHEYVPGQMVILLKYPAIKALSSLSHKLMKNPLYFLYQEPEPNITPIEKTNEDKLFTSEELRAYTGKKGSKGLYLSILGHVYDVQKGGRFYGPGGAYEFFTGRDGSRAFVSGDFTEEGLTDDISNLSMQDYLGLDEWVQFYNKDYTYVGKLIGRYYDEEGERTPYNLETLKWIAQAYSQKSEDDHEKILFPPCNSEWTPESGSRVYCTRKSGGVKRDWVGVPRKLFHPGDNRERCACIKNFGSPSHDPSRNPHANKGDLDYPNLREYPGCVPSKDSCHIPND